MKKTNTNFHIPYLLLFAALVLVPISCTKDTPGGESYPGTTLTSVTISGTNWAPVNLGYVVSTRPDGLLFQWGRMYGQEYVGTDVATGPVASVLGNNISNSSIFYSNGTTPYDWCNIQSDLWDMTSTNPCPSGWRVPTNAELTALLAAGSTWVEAAADNPDGLPGRWFGGNHSGNHAGSIFMPASGYRSIMDGAPGNRATVGGYWTSDVSGIYAVSIFFYVASADMSVDYRAGGLSVRCVKK